MLGTSDELVWYLPSPVDADEAAAPTIADLTPEYAEYAARTPGNRVPGFAWFVSIS